jgi:hypothetical protein
VISDTDEQPWDSDDLGGSAFAYLRLRRSEYDPDAVAAWGRRMGAVLDGGADVFCFVKHEQDAAGPELAHAFESAAGRNGLRGGDS